MAEFGANFPCFKPDGADAVGIVLGKLVAANLTVNLASGELYGDDALAEHVSDFVSGSLAMQTTDLEDEKAAVLYGCEVAENKVIYKVGDTAPWGKLGYYKALIRNGVRFYRGICYPHARAVLGNDNAQTKGGSITLQTANTSFVIAPDDAGAWREVETFKTAEEAKAWVAQQVGVDAGVAPAAAAPAATEPVATEPAAADPDATGS